MQEMGEEGKLYVGNLPYKIREDELRDKFEKYGYVEDVQIIEDRYTGRRKGFGFVTFKNAEDAEDAVKALNGLDYAGRELHVAKARPRREGGGGGGRRYDSYAGRRHDFDRR